MRQIFIFLLVAIGTFIIDQNIKTWAVEAVNGVEYATIIKGSCIDLELHYNRGVAFSMLAFLGPYLKWLQALLVVGILFFILKENYLKRYAFPVGLLIGAALGNVYDRFIHEGVVDYVAWHCGFKYSVFNYADVAIDIAIVWIIIMVYFYPQKSQNR